MIGQHVCATKGLHAGISWLFFISVVSVIHGVTNTVLQPASRLETLMEGLLGSSGGGRAEVSGRGPKLLRSCLGVEISIRKPSEAKF